MRIVLTAPIGRLSTIVFGRPTRARLGVEKSEIVTRTFWFSAPNPGLPVLLALLKTNRAIGEPHADHYALPPGRYRAQ
jgi:hypothetical protein